ncbi:MAG: enterochelin esterase domain-containing protein [Rhodopirellula sp. JB044]|uniref:enterochelin esterase domain-containing protein n=1 Tax=Rhodopirellula sp. JB044 TaxID=3342844 RepID=UPI00370CD376
MLRPVLVFSLVVSVHWHAHALGEGVTAASEESVPCYRVSFGSENATKTIQLDLSAGDFVRGSISGEKAVVWLLDSSQEKLRRLARGVGQRQDFMFVAGPDGPYSVELSGQTGTDYVLQLDSVIPISEQKTPSPPLASPLLANLQGELDAGGNTDAFWERVTGTGTPLVETTNVRPPLKDKEVLVTFLWRGARRNARLFGAPSGDHDEMHRLGNSDVWFRCYRVPSTARIDYRIAPDVPEFDGTPTERRRAILATVQRDPLNPNHEPTDPVDVYDGVSVAEMPDASPQPWEASAGKLLLGSIETKTIQSNILGNTRDIHLYRSPGYDPQSPDKALLVTFDGDQYRDEVKLPWILDYLVTHNEIPPIAAAMICNPSMKSRSAELPCNDDFARFVGDEFMPWLQEQGIDAAREKTVVAGASFGGLASAFIGYKHPKYFGNVFAQSGSFWWAPGGFAARNKAVPEWLTRQYANSPKRPVRYYLQAGTFENPSGIIQCTRHLCDVLQAKGNDVQYNEFVGGHGYFYWRYSFADGIRHLLTTK